MKFKPCHKHAKWPSSDLTPWTLTLNKGEMAAIIREFDMKSPLTGNDLSEPIEFNLMFQTNIGPTGLIKGFLR